MRHRLLTALALLLLADIVHAASPIKDPNAKAYKGETCAACHNTVKASFNGPIEESFDVVIVGGGHAGLAALHYLKDKKAVLLEAEKAAGGQMREDTWRGKHFSQGAAYLVQPYGILEEYYRSENLPKVQIPEPENSAFIDGKFYGDCWTKEGREKMPWTGEAKKHWIAFLEEMNGVNDRNESNQPIENFSYEQQQLDKLSAYDWMKQKGLTEEQIAHFDLYIPSCFGETSKQISAAGFANYISGELGSNFTMEGGMGAITNHIYKNHAKDVRLGCRVTHVVQTRDEVRVSYIDGEGRGHTIRGKTAIMAVPQNLLPELIPDLPQDKKDVIAHTKYAAYTVANVLCNEVLWDGRGYDTWIKGTFFRDIIDADWISRGGKEHADKKQPHVLTLYIPMGPSGMQAQMKWTPDEWKEKVLADLERVIPGSRKKVADVRFYRWGHSMHVCTPGFLTNAVPILRAPYYRIFFAGAEVEGLPCNESAIISGYKAATGVRAWLWDTVPSTRSLVPDTREPKSKSAME